MVEGEKNLYPHMMLFFDCPATSITKRFSVTYTALSPRHMVVVTGSERFPASFIFSEKGIIDRESSQKAVAVCKAREKSVLYQGVVVEIKQSG